MTLGLPQRKRAHSILHGGSSALVALLIGIQVWGGGTRVFAHAEAVPADPDLTAACTIVLPEEKSAYKDRLLDGRYDSRVSLSPGQALILGVPAEARGLYVAWYAAPASCTLTFQSAAGEVLSVCYAEPELLNGYYTLPDGCARVQITGETAFAVSELRAYACAAPPDNLAILRAPKAHPRLMLILTHTGDEAYYFGSLLPYCASEDIVTVFLMSQSRQAQQEAVELQYAIGARRQPVFAGLPYFRSYMDGKGMYELIDRAELESCMVRLIRRYRPEVLITHDGCGESGDCMHAMTAKHTAIAVGQAADAGKDRASAAEYGVWQVKTVYEHRVKGISPLYDTKKALELYSMTAAELAQSLFERYTFLRMYHQTVQDAPYFAQTFPVKPDKTDAQAQRELYKLLSELGVPIPPAVTAVPEPTASQTPAAIPASAAAYVSETAATEGRPDGMPSAAWIALLLCGAGGLAAWGIAQKRGTKASLFHRFWIFAAGLALIAGAVLLIRARETRPTAAAAPPTGFAASPAPETPDVSTIPSVQDTPAPHPTASPHPFAAQFRRPGDPLETVVFDPKNSRYAYRSDTLAISIERHGREDLPAVYFVAHIYMRDENAYRAGFGSPRQNGKDPLDACVMARRYRAVLGITGDNLLHEGFYNRGLYMRDGRVFSAETIGSAMVLTDDLSMRIYDKNDRAMLDEIEDGARDIYSFGPPLVLGGTMCEGLDTDRVARRNPRAGLGLVEPGHFVAIVVDGRLPGYSHGVLLPEFAQMFLDEGCVMAYNLDGGASATMVFMGEYINLRSSEHYRRLPDQLLWGYSELVPPETDVPEFSGLVEPGKQ